MCPLSFKKTILDGGHYKGKEAKARNEWICFNITAFVKTRNSFAALFTFSIALTGMKTENMLK